MSFLLCICLCLVSILGNYCCVSKYFFVLPKGMQMWILKSIFPSLLGVQTIFETISCSMSELFIAKWRNLCQFHHVVSAVVVLATLSTFQFQILVLPKCRVFQGTMTFFSYFWPDDDIGKVKKSSLLCVAKALESLAFVFLCCTPISLAPSWINIHCSLLNDVSSENSLYF